MSDKGTIRRPSMTLAQRYELMHCVKTLHRHGATDKEFAVEAQKALGFPVSAQTVAAYREAFNIPKTKLGTPSELRARIRELEGKLLRATSGGEAAVE